MHDAGFLVATSRRLEQAFFNHHPHVYHYPLGVDVDLFRPLNERTGDLVFGWAGNIRDKTKGVEDLLLPACAGNTSLLQAKGDLPHSEMAGFYNAIDVICIASEAEGTPLPLLEAMACGCFPITTDVGVVPEIITDGNNGLVVERSVEAFRQAFSWCQSNRDFVRRAGRNNASLIERERSWPVVARQFAGVLTAILNESCRQSGESWVLPAARGAQGVSDAPDLAADMAPCADAAELSGEDLAALLPAEKDDLLLVLGMRDEGLLGFLLDRGYQRIWGVDESPSRIGRLRRRFGDKVERLISAAPDNFLSGWSGKFACVVVLERSGRITPVALEHIAALSHTALADGGRIIIRARPCSAGNQAGLGILSPGGESPEDMLRKLLKSSGFSTPSVFIPGRSFSGRRPGHSLLRNMFGSCRAAIEGIVPPAGDASKTLVYADKEA
jgi:hypothetical protein